MDRQADAVFAIQKLVPCLLTVDGEVEPLKSDRPGQPPSLDQLQKWVGGNIEILPLEIEGQDRFVMVVDEEAKLKTSALPNVLASFQYKHSDILGPAVICADSWIE